MSATRLQLPVPVYVRQPRLRRRALQLEVRRLTREYTYPAHGLNESTVLAELAEILDEETTR